MTIDHEKAVNLAREILASEASKDYADARAAVAENPENKDFALEYYRLKAEYEELVNSVIEVLKINLVAAAGGCGGCCGGRK
jgi:cell fate (sporulation/competence/biofilm development) regulator YlbF (YheA/YmcA/DUF963 family)